jgi:taurine dioxygenase
MTATLTRSSIDVRPVTPVIGAEIRGIDLRQPLDEADAAQLKRALHQWKVLFLRDQDITDEQFLAFGRTFGSLTPAHPIAGGLPDHPEIWEREAAEYRRYLTEPSTPSARVPYDSNGWHIDITFVANPNRYSILRGIEVPEYGGDTLWGNLVAAYEGLSPRIRTLIDSLQAVHQATAYDFTGAKPNATARYVSLHPLVRVHPDTGEKAIFLNLGTTTHIVGLSANESRHILDLLAVEVTRPRYQVRFRWTPNAIAVWDNQTTTHAGPIDFAHFHEPRVVRRITIAGDLPEGPDGFRSRPLEGQLFEAGAG